MNDSRVDYNYGVRACTFNHFLPLKRLRLNKTLSRYWGNCSFSIVAVRAKLNLWVIIRDKSA